MKEMIYTEEKKDEYVSQASQHEDNVQMAHGNILNFNVRITEWKI